MEHEVYRSPLVSRYSSGEMIKHWSEQNRISTWRKLWLYLAKAEKSLGLNSISEEAINQMEENIENIDFEFSRQKEKDLRHDVMAHLYTFAEVAPAAKTILHLGATSCFVTDNAELILIKDAINMLIKKLSHVCHLLKNFCLEYKDMPTLGFTHFQPAQLTTVGKRACMWLQDLVTDLEALIALRDNIKFRSAKGTTGSQASYMALFNNNQETVEKLEMAITDMAGFKYSFGVTGQTYPRKTDVTILNTLSSFGASTHKIGTDIRLLSGLKELEEPFLKTQIGSSAMPYKRNPMLSERVCALSRHVVTLSLDASFTCATQWLERSLDDSANRRMSIPESFLTADAIINTLRCMFDGMVVYPKIIEARIRQELPFMATENIIMEMVTHGGNRQDCHEKIRQLSMDTSQRVKNEGKTNDLVDKIYNDPYFEKIKDKLRDIINPNNFTGCASAQVERFISRSIIPVLENIPETSEASFSNMMKSEV